ncbi:MAG: TldD/PmbA family protein [Acidobacteriota bacterium]
MLLNEAEAKRLTERILPLVKADEARVEITVDSSAHTRFAANSVTTSGQVERASVSIEVRFGKRSGSADTTELSNEALERTLRNAEEIARLSPEDPELQPMLGAQNYARMDHFSEKTLQADPVWRAQAAANSLKPARQQNLVAAGYVENRGRSRAVANSRGLFGYYRTSGCSFSTTIRTADGSGSGWAAQSANTIDQIDSRLIAERAIEKALSSRQPEAIEPGQYTVILEPAAVGNLIGSILNSFDARAADEGRSFLAKKGGGVRLEEKVFHEAVNIYSDPTALLTPGLPFDQEGLPTERMDFVRGGVIKNLIYSRSWAAKKDRKPTPRPTAMIMDGGTTSIQDMIRTTKRGVLVTRFWYIRQFDAQTLLLSGLTRDGTFLIEDGAVKRPIKNLRFNESVIALLNNIEALSPTQRVSDSGMPLALPAIKARNFTFTSLSDAV